MNKVFNYIRVSSKDQNEGRQIEAMNKFNKDNNIDNAIQLVDKATGTNKNRAELQLLLKVVGEGDLVVVKSVDRLSRNYKEVLEIWNIITNKGADIVILDMPLLDTRQYKDLLGDFISNLILQVLGYVAQQETEFRSKRQLEGIALAKEQGKHLGRPKVEYPSNWEEVYIKWKDKDVSGVMAMKELGLTKTTFYKLIKDRETIEIVDKIKDIVKGLPNVEFQISEIVPSWNTIDKGERIRVGKNFKKEVESGNVKGVKLLRIESDRHQWYKKQ